MITVLNPGLFTTVQDEGRFGYQAYGMPVAGAMDGYAYAVANILAGNGAGAAALEMTIMGGSFQFEADAFAAICGADMGASLNGVPVQNWSGFNVPAGSHLTFGPAVKGCRAYLAVRGGIDVPVVMGSRSTYVRGRLGGYGGRPLDKGDIIRTLPGSGPDPVSFRLPGGFIPRYGSRLDLRVITGPQDDHFTPAALKTLFSGRYVISPHWDRMGCRLEGPPLAHRAGADIVSDAISPGAIQVPGNGLPIILTADRQTTGGYPKIGTVIGGDLSPLAQMKPGDEIFFRSCTGDEAVAALKERKHTLEKIRCLVLSGNS
ncbi:MAG: biotin-dependent carboxyltransferase family protein [Bacillota bacterium]